MPLVLPMVVMRCWSVALTAIFGGCTGGLRVQPLAPFGGRSDAWLPAGELTEQAARRGFLRLPGVDSPGALLERSRRLGRVVAAHTVHPMMAEYPEVLRLSNRPEQGVPRVGAQWHQDGAFERRVFSHLLLQPRALPPRPAGTRLAHLGLAYQALSAERRREWARLASVNAYSGATHPLVHRHPVSGQMVLFAHLAQTGAVIRWPERLTSGRVVVPVLEAMEHGAGPQAGAGHTLLGPAELTELLSELDRLLDAHSLMHEYNETDLLLIDNLAVAHKASPAAHDPTNGLRVMLRTTLAGRPLDPPFQSALPAFSYIWGEPPLRDGGVWQSSDHYGVGFRYNESLPMFN